MPRTAHCRATLADRHRPLLTVGKGEIDERPTLERNQMLPAPSQLARDALPPLLHVPHASGQRFRHEKGRRFQGYLNTR